MSKSKHPTLRVAKAATHGASFVTLSTGYKARIRPVSAKLLDEVSGTVPEPDVPKQFIESKNREEYNPLDPNYKRAVREANKLRGIRVTEALVLFGVELLDPVPPLEEWLPSLRMLEKRGSLNLSDFDFNDPLDVEFVFKNFVAVSGRDLMLVSLASGISEKEVASAVAGFPGEPARDTHPAGGAETPAGGGDSV